MLVLNNLEASTFHFFFTGGSVLPWTILVLYTLQGAQEVRHEWLTAAAVQDACALHHTE